MTDREFWCPCVTVHYMSPVCYSNTKFRWIIFKLLSLIVLIGFPAYSSIDFCLNMYLMYFLFLMEIKLNWIELNWMRKHAKEKEFDDTAFGSSVKKDGNYIKLTTSIPEDAKTGEVVDIMLELIATVMERQLVDHLEGGKFSDPSPFRRNWSTKGRRDRGRRRKVKCSNLSRKGLTAYWFTMLPSWLSDDVADSVAVPAALRKTKVH